MKLFTKSKEPCTCNQYTDYDACCDTLKTFLNDCKVALKYNKSIRSLSILIQRDRRQGITHCPWCGTKLPFSLLDERDKVLLDEFGIDMDDVQKAKELPAEFLTDEWWKKRGL